MRNGASLMRISGRGCRQTDWAADRNQPLSWVRRSAVVWVALPLLALAAATSSTSASSAPKPDVRTPSSSKRSRSRSHSATSFPAPISHPLLSPALVPRSGSTPRTSRPFTMPSSPTVTHRLRTDRRTLRSDVHLRRPRRLAGHSPRPRLIGQTGFLKRSEPRRGRGARVARSAVALAKAQDGVGGSQSDGASIEK